MFKLNLNRVDRNALTDDRVDNSHHHALGFMNVRSSKYQPRPITITPVSEESLFDLKSDVECVPLVLVRKDSPYSVGLTPGGLCGAQELVGAHAGYEIADGIGGSLI